MPYEITPETAHADKAVLKFLEQFKEQPKLEYLLRSYIDQIQKLENAIFEVITIRGIEASEGLGLDQIGNIVDRQRLALTDSDYRIALRAQILINKSSGLAEDLIKITELSMPAGFTFSYGEEYPAVVKVTVNEQVNFLINVLFDNLLKAKAGGVRLFLFYTTQDPDNIFQFAPSTTILSDTDKGFGDAINPATGGKFIALLVG